jgi:hypothetical protein
VKFETAPSPHSTVMRVIGLAPFAVLPYVIGIETLEPAVGVAGTEGPSEIEAVVFTVTVTVDDAGVVVVVVPPVPPVPVPGVVVLVATPALAVTFAVRVVVSVEMAVPAASVLATVGFIEP